MGNICSSCTEPQKELLITDNNIISNNKTQNENIKKNNIYIKSRNDLTDYYLKGKLLFYM